MTAKEAGVFPKGEAPAFTRIKIIIMKRLIIALSFFAVTATASAIPAQRGIWKNVTLSDGTTVRVELRGDEFVSYWQAKDGRCFIQEEGTAFYKHVELKELVAKAAPKRAQANARRAARRAAMRKANIGGDHIEYTGKRKGLIILTQFKDKSFALGHNKKFYDEVANAMELSAAKKKLGFTGSVKKYFYDQSRGQFELDFDVVGPVTLDREYAYYGAHGGGSNDVRSGTMVAQACRKAADELTSSGFDLKAYDWDNNGYVDQVFVLYAGKGEASGGDENTIWPHEWSLESSDFGKALRINDDLSFNTYACGCEIFWDEIGRDITNGIGTICHEFSHCLGLPDMYDTGGNNFGMSYWDIMDQGSYAGNQFTPPSYTSFELAYAGWLDPIELKEPTTVKDMRPLCDGGQTFVIYNDANPNEYYLLENRQKVGWDAAMYGQGLLVLHVDYDANIWQWNRVNNTTSSYYDGQGNMVTNDHQRCTIIAADNDYYNSTESLSGDPFPNNGKTELTNSSQPKASGFNANTDGSMLMNKDITDIVQNADGTISFDFMGGSSTNIITGIKAIRTINNERDNRIYDLHGRYVGTDLNTLPKGIYVTGGKKIVR